MTLDPMGDRLKAIEGREADRTLMPLLPIMVRLDGRSFSKLTAKCKRPFDPDFMAAMHGLAEEMTWETQALIGYTQSDEITLLYFSDDYKADMWFGGRYQKLVSILASMASVKFNRWLRKCGLDALAAKEPIFDCRVWNVPTKEEAANTILWREQDATKNSIFALAYTKYSANQLKNKSGKEKIEMLEKEHGLRWDEMPDYFKRGRYFRRLKVAKKLSVEELKGLPEKHAAKQNPDLIIERWVMDSPAWPPLGRITNRVDVIFNGAEPTKAE